MNAAMSRKSVFLKADAGISQLLAIFAPFFK
jgi:hypothetical protein